jgi:hypothetical protein
MSLGGAILSDCGQYRYYLQRTWHDGQPRLCYIMLNPSTADATVNDATIRVCTGRAAGMGYGGIDVVNLFGWRATDPGMLYMVNWPVSEVTAPFKNDEIIARVVKRAGMVICAWGRHGGYMDRGSIVLRQLRAWGVVPHALRVNKDGSPAHPLRIPYTEHPFTI